MVFLTLADNGFSDFHTLILLPGSPLIRANKTKRELIWTALPAVNSSRRFNKIHDNEMVAESILTKNEPSSFWDTRYKS